MVQVEPARIFPRRAVKVSRQRNARMRLYREPGELGDRIGDDRVDRLRLVDEAIDKGRIGPVLKQSPHQVREQILVAADGCIDAAWSIDPLRSDDLLIERLTHPV